MVNNMKNKRKNKSGISLITLFLIIIIISILSATVIIVLNKNNIISFANETAFKTNIKAYMDTLEIYISDNYLNNPNFPNISIREDINITDKDALKNIFPNATVNDLSHIQISDGYLVYETDDKNEITWLDELGVKNSSNTTKYLDELKIVKLAITNSKDIIGRSLNDTPVTVNNIQYSNGYYILEEDNDYSKLGLTNIKFGPYIVNYDKKEVINVNGRNINGEYIYS